MTPLTTHLREKLEPEENLSWEEEDALHELDRACLRGQYLENARLKPLLERLIDCVEALEKYATQKALLKAEDGSFVELHSSFTPAGEALSALEKEIQK